jgi:hypothetical protein
MSYLGIEKGTVLSDIKMTPTTVCIHWRLLPDYLIRKNIQSSTIYFSQRNIRVHMEKYVVEA